MYFNPAAYREYIEELTSPDPQENARLVIETGMIGKLIDGDVNDTLIVGELAGEIGNKDLQFLAACVAKHRLRGEHGGFYSHSRDEREKLNELIDNASQNR